MVVNLSPELQELVREKVESGLYRDEGEVIAEALRLLDRVDHTHAGGEGDLRAAIQKGFDDIAAGRYTVINNEEELIAFFDDL